MEQQKGKIMSILFEESLTFGDVLLKPQYSEVKSRQDVSLFVTLPKSFKFNYPVVPSNMKTVSEEEMLRFCIDNKMLGILHRFLSIDEQIKIIESLRKNNGNKIFDYISVSLGIGDADKLNLKQFIKLGVKIITVDIAHANNKYCLDFCRWISETYPDVLLIAGNVSDYDGTKNLIDAGVDVVKLGQGSGRICSTRLNTGNGVPQLTAIMEGLKAKIDAQNKSGKTISIISDGGCSTSGDVAKALCFADMVMLGGMFAGTDEAPGNIVELDGVQYKEYTGSSTYGKNGRFREGVESLVKYKGKAKNVLEKIEDGLKSSCSYQGAHNLIELKLKAKFVKTSASGLKESGHYDIHNIK